MKRKKLIYSIFLFLVACNSSNPYKSFKKLHISSTNFDLHYNVDERGQKIGNWKIVDQTNEKIISEKKMDEKSSNLYHSTVNQSNVDFSKRLWYEFNMNENFIIELSKIETELRSGEIVAYKNEQFQDKIRQDNIGQLLSKKKEKIILKLDVFHLKGEDKLRTKVIGLGIKNNLTSIWVYNSLKEYDLTYDKLNQYNLIKSSNVNNLAIKDYETKTFEIKKEQRKIYEKLYETEAMFWLESILKKS